MAPPGTVDPVSPGAVCARAGCRAPAEFAVNWRNPRIHGAERVKVWPACLEHVDFLREYLESRSFPVQVTPSGVALALLPPEEADR